MSVLPKFPDSSILEIEAALTEKAAEVERLTKALAEAEYKLSLTWPGTWHPVMDENTELIDPAADDDRRLYINDEGTGIEFTCDSGELEGYFNLPSDYAVCRWNRTADDERADRLTKELVEELGDNVVLYKVESFNPDERIDRMLDASDDVEEDTDHFDENELEI